MTDDQLSIALAARARERRCAHCHQPIHAAAVDPRWQAYCDVCARRLAGRRRHPESA
jgi:formamidopyrimidine-DNA glycosylase